MFAGQPSGRPEIDGLPSSPTLCPGLNVRGLIVYLAESLLYGCIPWQGLPGSARSLERESCRNHENQRDGEEHYYCGGTDASAFEHFRELRRRSAGLSARQHLLGQMVGLSKARNRDEDGVQVGNQTECESCDYGRAESARERKEQGEAEDDCGSGTADEESDS